MSTYNKMSMACVRCENAVWGWGGKCRKHLGICPGNLHCLENGHPGRNL